MSQNLVPLDGGRESIALSTPVTSQVALSRQYQKLKGLAPRPTEWNPNGRPVYGRLPSASERYKVLFPEEGAYVYLFGGQTSSGPRSLEVKSSPDGKFLLIRGGKIVWKYGELDIDPTVIDLAFIGMQSTRYAVGYQLIYDDSPLDFLYDATGYSLAGVPMTVTSGTDSEAGWRFPASQAFTGRLGLTWRNRDSMFPSYSGDAFLEWSTQNLNSLSKIVLRCPENFVASGSAQLLYRNGTNLVPVAESVALKDSEGFYFEFNVPDPQPQTGWRVEWSNPDIAIYSVFVSGTVTIQGTPATSTSYAALAAYPANSIPKYTVSSQGKELPVTFCQLAFVDVNALSKVEDIDDTRRTIFTGYQPVADWLTKNVDTDLINMYMQVNNYPTMWMNPQTCLKHEYETLGKSSITVEE